MSLFSARSSNFFTSSGSMRKRRLRSSSCVFSARHTSTTTLMPPSIPTSAPAHSSGYASLAWSWIRSKSPTPILSGNLLLPEALGEVFVSTVAQDGDDRPGLYLPGDPEGHRDRSSRRDADQDPILARHPLDHLVGVLGPHRPILVGDGRVVDGRHDGALHVLHAFEAVEGRVGFEGDNFYPRAVLLETRRRADESAARAKSRDEVRHLAIRLLPDLRRRRLIVRARVGRIGVLVRIEVALRVLGVEPPRLADGPVRAVAGVGQHEVDAVSLEDLLSRLAGVLRHAELYPIAERGPDPGVRYPSVPARRIQDSLLGRQSARLLPIPDHPQRGSVLYRSTGVVPLRFAEDVYAGNLGRDARQLQKWRAADQLRHVRPRPPINPSNHVGINYTGWRFSVQRSEVRYLTNMIAERREQEPPGYGWCVAEDYT